ncbi:putative tail measure protein [Salmonella phage 19]|nr:putative tail measure protein [Salmonella phage 19]
MPFLCYKGLHLISSVDTTMKGTVSCVDFSGLTPYWSVSTTRVVS